MARVAHVRVFDFKKTAKTCLKTITVFSSNSRIHFCKSINEIDIIMYAVAIIQKFPRVKNFISSNIFHTLQDKIALPRCVPKRNVMFRHMFSKDVNFFLASFGSFSDCWVCLFQWKLTQMCVRALRVAFFAVAFFQKSLKPYSQLMPRRESLVLLLQYTRGISDQKCQELAAILQSHKSRQQNRCC